MNYIEFSKKEKTYLNIEENTKIKCKENNVEYYSYLGSFVRYKLFNYLKSKSLIKTIGTLDFTDKISTRAILNKRDFSTKEEELRLAINKHNKIKKDLFKWLDNTKDPYFFILNPVYSYGAGINYKSWVDNKFGCIKEQHTGATNENIDIACEYAKYKVACN